MSHPRSRLPSASSRPASLRPTLRTTLLMAVLAGSMSTASVSLAQDDGLDDLPDDLLGADDKGGVKVKDSAPSEDADPEFDFGDDPDWDEAPASVPVPGGLDEDPPDDISGGSLPDDEFFGEDPPDDFIQVAPTAVDPLDEDPPVGLPPAPVGSAAPKLGLGLDTKGKSPLGDHYPATVVGRDLDAVVVELPVLVASKPADFEADYWLITEVMVEDRKVAESRHLVTRASVADMGPTVVWSKSHVPVLERAGQVQLKVSQKVGETDARQLFSKTIDYAL